MAFLFRVMNGGNHIDIRMIFFILFFMFILFFDIFLGDIDIFGSVLFLELIVKVLIVLLAGNKPNSNDDVENEDDH